MHLDLRPLTVSEFLDRTFSIYRHRFLLFVALMAPQAVLSLVAAVLWGVLAAQVQDGNLPDTVAIAALVVGVGVSVIAFTLTHWVLYVLGIGATAAAVSDLYGRLVPDVGSSFGAARRRLGSLLWLTFLMAVRLGGVMLAFMTPGLILFALAFRFDTGPGRLPEEGALAALGLTMLGVVGATIVVIWMALRYGVAIPAVMLEHAGGGAAIRRSLWLTRGLLGRLFLLMICATMVAYASMMVLQMPFVIATLVVGPETRTGFWLNLIGTATGTAGQTLTAPIVAIGVAVLYFEARVRHEALDLQVMTDALPQAPVVASAPPSLVTAPPPLP
jgi:hypothetical protein